MKLITVLTIICVVAALLLGLTYSLTANKIKMQEENVEKEALKAVLPSAVGFSEKIKGKTMEYYKGLDIKGEVLGYAFIGEGKGYSSMISIMIGIDREDKVIGIKILKQNETPGLGTRIEEVKTTGTIWDIIKGKKIEKPKEPWFQDQFKGKPIDDVEIITGATITSEAVIDIIKSTVEKFKSEELGITG